MRAAFLLMPVLLCAQSPRELNIITGRGELLQFERDIERLAISEPKIADAVLVSPPLTVPGWSPKGVLPGRKRPGLPGWVFNTELINLTGHPAIVLPAGRHENGVPFGIQIVGPRFAEGLLFGFAEAWERARPWSLTAPGYQPFGE